MLEPRTLLAAVTGQVWHDVDRSDTRTLGDLPQPGVEIALIAENGPGIHDDRLAGRTTTDAEGRYAFAAADGAYRVRVLTDRQTTFAAEGVGSEALDSDVDATGRSASVLVAGSQSAEVDALVQLAADARPLTPVADFDELSNVGAGRELEAIDSDLSDDGRFVVFISGDDHHVDGRASQDRPPNQVFLYDRLAERMRRLSQAPDGSDPDDRSDAVVISGDGSTVAFRSDATNLAPGTGNIFFYDVASQTLSRPGIVSHGNGFEALALSDDGTTLAFSTSADTGPFTNVSGTQVFTIELPTGTVSLVSARPDGQPHSGAHVDLGGISDDGRYVAFRSRAVDLDAGGPDSVIRGYVRDRLAGTTQELPPQIANGTEQSVYGIAISGDGNTIATENFIYGYRLFDRATNAEVPGDQSTPERRRLESTGRISLSNDGTRVLVPGESFDRLLQRRVYGLHLFDRTTGTVEFLSRDGLGDVRYGEQGFYDIGFLSGDGNTLLVSPLDLSKVEVGLPVGPEVMGQQLFAHDLVTDERQLITRRPGEAGLDGTTRVVDMTADGRLQIVYSSATNIAVDGTAVSSDGAGVDYFLRDHAAGTLERLAFDIEGQAVTPISWRRSTVARISPNGRYIAFIAETSLARPTPTYGDLQVYLHDRTTGETRLITKKVNRDGELQAGLDAVDSHVSVADNGRVAFTTRDDFFLRSPTQTVWYGSGDIDGHVVVYDPATDSLVAPLSTLEPNHSSQSWRRNRWSNTPVLSGDGQTLFFLTDGEYDPADDEFPSQRSGDLYRYDLATGSASLVSVQADGGAVDGMGSSVEDEPELFAVSYDGSQVAMLLFRSRHDRTISSSTTDVFLHTAGQSQLRRLFATEGLPNGSMESVQFTDGGDAVLAATRAANLLTPPVPMATVPEFGLVKHDLLTDDVSHLTLGSLSYETRYDDGLRLTGLSPDGALAIVSDLPRHEQHELPLGQVFSNDDRYHLDFLIDWPAAAANATPTLPDGQVLSVDETAEAGDLVGTITASDDGSLSFRLLDGDGTFAIDAATGQLTLAAGATLDFETQTTYTRTVQVRDDGTPLRGATETVTIVVNDIDETPAVSDLVVPLAETAPGGFLVGTVPASGLPSQTLSLAILGGNDDGAFTLDAATGELRLTSPSLIDFETGPTTYTLVIKTSVVGDPLHSATSTVTVNLRDENDTPTLDDGAASVDENVAVGTVVMTLAALDPDAQQSHVFELVGDNAAGLFSLDPDGTVRTAADLDFESLPPHPLTLRVRVVDDAYGRTLSDTATLSLSVTDVLEPITLGDADVTTDERPTTGTVLATLAADSGDAGPLTYQLVGGGQRRSVRLQPVAGGVAVVVENPLAFETASGPLELTVRATATDDPARFAEATLRVTLEDLVEPSQAATPLVSRIGDRVRIDRFTGNGWESGLLSLPGPVEATAIGDFDGDRRRDLLAQVGGDLLMISDIDDAAVSGRAPVLVGAAPNVAEWIAGDFDGDGRQDLAGYDVARGQLVVSRMRAGTMVTEDWQALPGSRTWVNLRDGDFDGDGRRDLAIQEPNTGKWYFALSRETAANIGNDSTDRFLTQSWGDSFGTRIRFAGIEAGDVDGDGADELLALNPVTGYWLVGFPFRGDGFETWARWTTEARWTNVLVGDFDGDGQDDVAAQTATPTGGRDGVWYVAPSVLDPNAGPGEPRGEFVGQKWSNRWNPAWGVTSIRAADLDGDGRTDLLGHTRGGGFLVGLSTGQSLVAGRGFDYAAAPGLPPLAGADELLAGHAPQQPDRPGGPNARALALEVDDDLETLDQFVASGDWDESSSAA